MNKIDLDISKSPDRFYQQLKANVSKHLSKIDRRQCGENSFGLHFENIYQIITVSECWLRSLFYRGTIRNRGSSSKTPVRDTATAQVEFAKKCKISHCAMQCITRRDAVENNNRFVYKKAQHDVVRNPLLISEKRSYETQNGRKKQCARHRRLQMRWIVIRRELLPSHRRQLRERRERSVAQRHRNCEA